MKLHAYKGEKVGEVTFDSLKSEVCSAACEFFRPITIASKALVKGGQKVLEALRGRPIGKPHATKGDSSSHSKEAV